MGEATVSFLCAHIQRQTCSPFQTDAGLWQSVGVKFSLCRQLSWETETRSVSHLPDATAVLARSAGLGGYALAREKKILVNTESWSNSGPCPFSLQTMAYSHCRINSQSFQWLFFFYLNSLWEKNKHGAVAEMNLVPSRTACALRHAHVYMSDCRNTMFPARGIFACSRFSFSSKWRCTCWPTPIIVSGTLPSRALDNLV